jgi:hypothetical protein
VSPVFSKVHPSTSIDDAVTQLDSRVPLLHSERLLIAQSLYDLAFREGARQGRLAGIEAVQNRLREYAWQLRKYPGRNTDSTDETLDRLAAEFNRTRKEYEDPTVAIRRRLESRRNGLAAPDSGR